MRLFGCVCGQFHSPAEGLGMAGGGRVEVPAPFYVIEHADGVALFDCSSSNENLRVSAVLMTRTALNGLPCADFLRLQILRHAETVRGVAKVHKPRPPGGDGVSGQGRAERGLPESACTGDAYLAAVECRCGHDCSFQGQQKTPTVEGLLGVIC